MKAIRIHGYGDRSVLRGENAPEPSLLPHDVLVRVRAAGVNPADWQFRRGDFQAVAPLRFPAILGWDVAGTVARAGPEARGFVPGEAVFAMCDMGRDGAYAEFVAVRDEHLAPAPRSLSLEHCAAVPLSALTAWQALFDLGQLQPGQTVLVHGAAGSVGLFAVQMARARGAHVVSTASPANHTWLQSLGAERCLDYSLPRWTEGVRDVDLVLDGAGGPARKELWSVLRPAGTFVAIAMPPADPTAAESQGYRATTAQVVPSGERLRQIASMIDAGQLQVFVDSVFPLEDVAAAHQRSESRHARGKVLLSIAPE